MVLLNLRRDLADEARRTYEVRRAWRTSYYPTHPGALKRKHEASGRWYERARMDPLYKERTAENGRRWLDENKEHRLAMAAQWRAANPGRSTRTYQALRQRFFDLYGRCCALCGFDNELALTLDHVGGWGNTDRKQKERYTIFKDAVAEHRPDRYRTLCMNCQFIDAQGRARSKKGIA